MAKSGNQRFLEALLEAADDLAVTVSASRFPVVLRPLAERRRVTSIEFLPLLVDALLTSHPTGFRILLNSGGRDQSELKRIYETEHGEQMLDVRTRFSIAHELAHTLFYDLADDRPRVSREFRSGGGKTMLENLERNCNILAGHLLLPTNLLRERFRHSGFLSRDLVELSKCAGVSIEALVRRLSRAEPLLVEAGFRGCVALLVNTVTATEVRAIAKTKSVPIAREFQLLNPGERWQLVSAAGSRIDVTDILNASSVHLSVPTELGNEIKEYTCTAVECTRYESSTSYLVSFDEKGREENQSETQEAATFWTLPPRPATHDER
jgi:hypothetical protein